MGYTPKWTPRKAQIYRELWRLGGEAHPKEIAEVVNVGWETIASAMSNALASKELERQGNGRFAFTSEGWKIAKEHYPDGVDHLPVLQVKKRRSGGGKPKPKVTQGDPTLKQPVATEKPGLKTLGELVGMLGELYELVGVANKDSVFVSFDGIKDKISVVRRIDDHQLFVIAPL